MGTKRGLSQGLYCINEREIMEVGMHVKAMLQPSVSDAHVVSVALSMKWLNCEPVTVSDGERWRMQCVRPW